MADAGRILPVYQGNWVHRAYEVLDQVTHAGSTYTAKNNIADSVIAPDLDTANWFCSSKGFVGSALSDITVTDASGLLGTMGETVGGQELTDEIADRVATKLIPYDHIINTSTVSNTGSFAMDAIQLNSEIIGTLGQKVSRLEDKIIYVKDHGVKGDGITDDYTALNNLISQYQSPCEFYFQSGTYVINGNLIFNKNIVIKMAPGALLKGNGIVTINGDLFASINKIFEGNIIGLGTVYPEWFGAIPDNATDCSDAFDLAYTCMANSNNKRKIFVLQDGNYILSRTFNLYPTANNNFSILGGGSVFGTRIKSGNTFNGNALIYLHGNNDSISQICNFTLKDFGLSYLNISTAPIVGLQIGDNTSANAIIGLHNSLIENVTSELKNGIVVYNSRLITFRRCSTWQEAIDGAVGLLISNTTKFCGDMVFEDCNFVANSNGRGLLINTQYQIAGIRFRDCVFYRGLIMASTLTSNGGEIGDIWFDSCAFDGFSTNAFIAESDGTNSEIRNIMFNSTYCRGITGIAFRFSAINSAKIFDINFNGGNFLNINDYLIQLSKCKSVNISNLEIYELNNPTGACVQINDSKLCRYSNNNLRENTSYVSYLVIVNGESESINVSNNLSEGYALGVLNNNTSPAASKILDINNL